MWTFRRAAVPLALAAVVGLAPAPAAAQAPNRAILRGKLLTQLTHISDAFNGVFGIEIIDLTDSSHIGVNQDLVFPQGSAIKVPILIELYRQADAHPALLTQQRRITADTRTGGSGVLQYFSDGGSELSNADLAVLMITLSDNGATNLLIHTVGMDSVNHTLRTMGFTQTKLQRYMIRPEASARGQENISTPAEAASIMARLAHCALPLSAAACHRVTQLLELPKDEPVRSVIPARIPVASKPGGITGVATSWALVELPGRPFVIATMTSYGGTDGDDAIRAAAKAAYAYFIRLAGVTPYGTRVR
ncbi:MAG TPA: serine hydrolase [Gemmatimonadaceae bacterium]|nr:serine hydrolase [Gemmatimonadaceae bacterium]